MKSKIQKWKKANEIYSGLVHLSVSDALKKLQTIEELEPDISILVSNLIQSGEESNEYIEEELISFPQIGSQLSNRLEDGEEIDNYQLVEKIGKGGMSTVYKAIRLNTTNQKAVAIKVFFSDERHEKLLKNFVVEQKILSSLSHPNIISMHHGGKTEKGISYIVMELLEGALDIDKYVEKNNVVLREKVLLILKAANAIAYAHSKLIIHRDIKPSNILIDNKGQLKVVDFGIAKILEKEGSSKNTTIMALTPSFASPEQLNSKEISVSTDVFSLALVALSLINGKSPFETNRLLKTEGKDEKEIEKAIKQSKVDTDLKNILNKALKTNPKYRYESIYKFADDLSSWLDNKPVSATKDSLIYQLKKLAKRRTALFATFTTLFFSLTIGLVILSWQYKRIKLEAQKAEQVKSFMLDAFESTDPDKTEGEEVTADDILESAAIKLKYNSEMGAEIRFELLQSIGIAFGKIGKYEKAIDYLEQSLKLKPNHSRSISYLVEYLQLSDQVVELNKILESINTSQYSSYQDISRILRVKANNLATNGELKKAKETIDLLIKENTKEKNSNDYILNQAVLAGILYNDSKHEEAIILLKQVIKEQKLKNSHSIILSIREQLIDAYNKNGDFEQALIELNNLIQIQKSIYDKEHPAIALSYYQLASILRSLGQLNESEQAINESLRIRLNIFGSDSIKVAHSLHLKSILYSDKGELEESISLTKQVIDIFTRVKGADHKETLVMGSNLASLLNRTNKSEEALELLVSIYKVNLQKLGKVNHETLYTKKIIAYTLSKLQRHEEAIAEIEEAVEIAKSNYKLSHPIVASLVYNQAMIYRGNNQLEKALDTYNEIIEKQMLLESNLLYSMTLKRLALLNEELNNYQEAYKLFKQSIALYQKNYGENSFNTLDLELLFVQFLKKHGQKQEAQEWLDRIEKNIGDTNTKSTELRIRLEQVKNNNE
jgi:serine/threonine-protein kinase